MNGFRCAQAHADLGVSPVSFTWLGVGSGSRKHDAKVEGDQETVHRRMRKSRRRVERKMMRRIRKSGWPAHSSCRGVLVRVRVLVRLAALRIRNNTSIRTIDFLILKLLLLSGFLVKIYAKVQNC